MTSGVVPELPSVTEALPTVAAGSAFTTRDTPVASYCTLQYLPAGRVSIPVTDPKVPLRDPASRMRSEVPTGGLTPGDVPIVNVPARVATPLEVSFE